MASIRDKVEITDDGVLTLVRFLVPLSLHDMMDVIDLVAAEHNNFFRAYNCSHCFALNSGEVKTLTAHGRKTWPRDSKVAYIAEDDLGFGLLRMLEVYREQDNYETKVFRSEEEGLVWLQA